MNIRIDIKDKKKDQYDFIPLMTTLEEYQSAGW